MKLTTDAGQLRTALALANSVVPKKPSQAVFSGVRLTVSAATLKVTGSAEQETIVTASVPVTNPENGSAVLPPEPLIKFLATLPDKAAVTVHADSRYQITVETDGSNPYTFRAKVETFPDVALDKSDTRPANLTRLSEALAGVSACASDNKLVQLVSDAAGLRLHATDNVRVARTVLAEAGFGQFSGLVPLDVLKKVADAPVDTAIVDRRGRVVTFTGDTVSIMTRLIDSVYPSVDSVLDDTPMHSIEVPAAALRARLNRIGSVAGNRPLAVSISGDELLLRLESSEIGSGGERIELETPARTEITFGINLEFLMAAVTACNSATLTIGWTGPKKPIFVSASGPLPTTVVIMPVEFAS